MEKMNLELHTLVLFRDLLQDPIVQKLSRLLSIDGKTPTERVSAYADFVSALWQRTGNLTNYLLQQALEAQTPYVDCRARNEVVDAPMEQALRHELNVLQRLSQLTATQVQEALNYDGFLPEWQTEPVDFHAAYRQRMEQLHTVGYGPFARHHMFIAKNGVLNPVLWPDPITLAELTGYHRERQAVIGNTLALLSGAQAANVLLYGDAGTGKSSTIKAIANEYRSRGLRLVEVTKGELGAVPDIIASLGENPLKFILFVDDLSFESDNDEFTKLKAILEGSALARTPNIAIYVTSNRRHLVRETFADRDGDDMHVNETMQQLGSLADRFGLSIGFYRPDKELYLSIAHLLAERSGIMMEKAQLDEEAERYALERGGRSPRVARQFIEFLQRKVIKKVE